MPLRFCKLVVLGTLSMPGHTSQKLYYQLMENFMFTCMRKMKFFCEIIMKMQTGLCTLGILDQINKGIPGIQYIGISGCHTL